MSKRLARHQIAEALAAASPAKRPIGDRSRINIVSSDLCDHTIKALAPSLERHKNCDIIDLNPGVGLWSSKLHEFLKPRTHILLEPDEKLYLPFLKPLLEKRNSTYKLAPWSGVEWSSYMRIAEEGFLPHQKLLPSGHEALNKPSDTLLFVANLGHYPPKKRGSFNSIAALMINQLMSAVRNHSIFQAYGLVRMLIWIGDKEKNTILPRSIANRRKSSVQIESTCDIREIAGYQDEHRWRKRPTSINQESAEKVALQMLQNGINFPLNRQSPLHKDALKVAKEQLSKGSSTPGTDTSTTTGPVVADSRVWHKELNELEEKLITGEVRKFQDERVKDEDYVSAQYDSRRGRKRGVQRERTPEYQRLILLRALKKLDFKRQHKMEGIVKEIARLDAIELALMEGKIPHDEIEKKESELAKSKDKVYAQIDGLREPQQEKIFLYLDDRRAIKATPPVLMWDRRTEEPLNVEAEEFFPNHHLALLDFQPRPVTGAVARSAEAYDVFTSILGYLYMQPKQSIVRGLESLAPGAADYILPRAPSLQDLRKGGLQDLEHLRVRMLTPEMLDEIIAAWESWPFKPSTSDLILKMGLVPYMGSSGSAISDNLSDDRVRAF